MEVYSMAGSRKYFIYQLNGGTQSFAVNIDESNTEAVMGAAGDYGATDTILNTLPRNIQPRRAVYRNAAGTRSISVVVLDDATYDAIASTDPTIDDPLQSGETLTLSRLEPERRTLTPTAIDTGLNDGDAT